MTEQWFKQNIDLYMLEKTNMSDIFYQACEDDGGIRILLNLVNKKTTPQVCKFVATFSTQDWKNEGHFRFVAHHEVSHPSYMPEWYEDHLKYFSLLQSIFNNEKSHKNLDDLMFIANVIYDMMVDRRNQKKFNVKLQESIEYILMNLSNGDIENSGTVYILLICFYCRCFGKKPNINFDYVFEKEFIIASKKCLNIVDSRLTKLNKVKGLGIVINNLLYDRNESLSDSVDNANNSIVEMSNSDMPSMNKESEDPLSDALEDGTIDNKTFDYFFDKENEDNSVNDEHAYPISDNECLEGDEDDKPNDYIKDLISCAQKNIKIIFKNSSRTKIKGIGNNKNGMMVRSGIWNENDAVSKLDMLSTISSHGMFVPGEYAVKKSILSESLKDKELNYNIHIILDTSGSIDIGNGSIALFSLIELAKKKRNNVTVSLFHDKLYYSNSINKSMLKKKVCNNGKYKELQYNIAKFWQNGGTDLSVAFDYLKDIFKSFGKRKNNLIILITDFQDEEKHILGIINDINKANVYSKVIVTSIGNHICPYKNLMNDEVLFVQTNSINSSVVDIFKNISL